ncbi:ABC transporter permease [Legionella oakridgensis]|uniref:ABC transporter permease n=1 Tax=Legionella oakridgensis TaxID=29423 RepID=UPI0003DDFC72|nr:ABC transporter permease [Legionella oakridgensis]ETO93508.1 ABC-type dipeptide/oligopeptide/nickel transport system, permease component [Legionella oakridgensis RV-2-2007]
MTLELLWTDECFLLVLLLSAAVWMKSMRKMHVRRAFQRIFKQPIAVSAAIILMFFLIIAVMDSLHYKTADEHQPKSLLDRILAPLGDDYEKTYSAPMSLTLYATETIMVDGQVEQIYPRLKYPPKTLQDDKDIWHQLVEPILLITVALALAMVAAFWAIMIAVRTFYTGKLSFTISRAEMSALVTLFICCTLMIAGYWLSRYLHVLGTGKIGQDIFFYAVKSIRTGLVIGILTTLFMMPLALILGIAAGYFGGMIDDIIQYIYTTLSSIPGVLLITASILSMQTYIANHPEQFTTLGQNADARLLALCFILGVTSWTSLCRLLRAEALKLREIDFVLAAQALGSSAFKIIFKHLLPNVMHIVLITLVLDFSFLVLAEAVLSYVGVGVSPLTISWGNMINAARLELAREPIIWWPMFAAFLFMFVLVLASNLFADAVRDAFDPRRASL